NGHDCGFAINPLSVEGQLQGAIHMGLGFALCEEIPWDRGQPLNPSFLDYKVLNAMDMPPLDVFAIETVDREGPYGAKEVGEGTVGPVAPAVANAVAGALGTRFMSLPLRAESILTALEGAGADNSDPP
ncbi:MAG: molybdopterin-dependent oxidoreductase, partial [Dehalococcoidia bacterium]|nr:molybdopterin-dependent oxidoreductase [Dehalococcoidia bacterium]